MKRLKTSSLLVICTALFALTLASCSSGGGGSAGPPPLSTNAQLASLTLSVGTLSPPFSSATMTYTSDVTLSIVSTGVTVSASSGKATMTINGATVLSNATHTVALPVGQTAITIVVTAEDGTSTKTYAITATRSAIGLSPAVADVISGQTTTLNAMLESNALSDMVVTLTSSHTGTATVTLPTSVTIFNGTSQAAFATTSTSTGIAIVKITATLVSGDTATATVNVWGACTTAADCGTDTECLTYTCTANACGSVNSANGTACTAPNASATCNNGVCGGGNSGTCNAGYANCDVDLAVNGCETNIGGEVENCGMCGLACSNANIPTPICTGGICGGTCSPGWTDCDTDAATGCETNTGGDANNCGVCGLACSTNHIPTPSCSGGICGGTCSPGWTDCDTDAATGCETNTGGDANNCGVCGLACSSNHIPMPSCSGGICGGTCSPGWADCDTDPATGCETNTGGDVNNCGGCGLACSSTHIPTPSCSAGICGGTCAPGWTDCDADPATGCETNTGGDVNNCGACGNVCASGICTAGVCQTLTQGSACTSGGQCATGNCVDGYCCNTACAGACNACSAAKGASTNGTCGYQTGTVCRAAAGVCDVADVCDGFSPACPADFLKASSYVCQAASCAGSTYTPAANCTGVSASCPASTPTSCDDGDACTTDACSGSICSHTPIVCVAGDQCHNAGVCNPSTGICSTPAKTDGIACNDGNFCTSVDVCSSGICMGSSPIACTPLDACHDAGACNPSTGVCSNPAKTDGTDCGSPLTCQGGVCTL